jgi:hypothetical protein
VEEGKSEKKNKGKKKSETKMMMMDVNTIHATAKGGNR